MDVNNDYAWWQNALKGTFGAMHGNDPQPGFYKNRHGNKAKGIPFTYTHVAIWRDGETMVALEDGKEVPPDKIDDLWTYCCRTPITEDLYRRIDRKEPWPDAIEEMIGPGHNNPPEGEEKVDELQSAINAAVAQLANPVTTQAECDRLANHADRLTKLWQAQETARKVEKAPHLEAAEAVDAKYRPVLDKIKEVGTLLKKAITAWLLKEKQRIDKETEQKIVAGEPAPEAARPKAGTTGRSTALRTYKSAAITDYKVCLAHFADSKEVMEVVQMMADRCVRAGLNVPGCEVKTEQRAA